MARESKKKESGGIRWRLVGTVLALIAVCVSTAIAARKIEHYVTTDPEFTLSRYQAGALTVEGLNYASRLKVQRVFAADLDHSVFSAPLEERRRRLLAIDWIEDASVSRVWPDHLVARIRERRPVAFVLLRSGVLLIDANGVLLDQPAQSHFTFAVLKGIREDETEAQRAEKVRLFLHVQEDMGYLAKSVSEIHVADQENIRIVAQVDHGTVELLLGDGNFGTRFQNFLKHYPDIQRQSPGVKTFDLRLDDRITAKD